MKLISIARVTAAAPQKPRLRALFQRLASALDRVVEHRLERWVSAQELRRADHEIKRCRKLLHQELPVSSRRHRVPRPRSA